jgi:mono/diheme cytochrome c family protein
MRYWGLVILGLSLTGCPGFGDKTIDDLNTVDMVTYEGQIKAILDARCATCHAATPIAGAPNALHDYASASAQAGRIHARAVVELTMPPGAALSPEDRALIDAWFKGGAPEGVTSDDAGVAPDMSLAVDMSVAVDSGSEDMAVDDDSSASDAGSDGPTWNDDVSPIMAMGCAFAGCHGGDAPSAALELETYAGYEAGGANGDLTGDGDPEQSLFIDHLRARNGKLLMPLGSGALPEAQIELIEAWISAGSPEN